MCHPGPQLQGKTEPVDFRWAVLSLRSEGILDTIAFNLILSTRVALPTAPAYVRDHSGAAFFGSLFSVPKLLTSVGLI